MTAYCDYSRPGKPVGSLVDVLRARAQSQPDQKTYVFLQQGEEVGKLTYGELDEQARAIAAALLEAGATGKPVLLLYPSGLEFIAAFFGCLYAGAIATPAYPPRRNQNLARLEAILGDAQAVVALTTPSLFTSIERWFPENSELAKLRWLTTAHLTPHEAGTWEAKPRKSEIAFLQYTSGSTGTPKGVMVSHRNLMHNLNLIEQYFAHSPSTQGVIWLPPYHDMGLIGGLLQPLYAGFPVTLMSSVDFLQKPLRWLQAISRLQATISGAPNFAYDYCVRKITAQQRASLDLSSWEVAFVGAEPVRAQTLENFATTFAPCGFRKEAFYPCYGMAEATLIVSGGEKTAPPVICSVERAALEQDQVVLSTAPESQALVGCGRSLTDQNLLIVDPDTLMPSPANQVGEIWVAGPSVAQGYWQRPDATQRDFQAHLATGAGPFLRTGDLGFLRNDELFITGRIKDVIIIRGQNHYPQDIELTVENSHPALRPNCGAAVAAAIKGTERLVIVQEVKRSYLRKLNVKDVVDSIRRAVNVQHDLKVYATVLVKTGSIPRTTSGKIQRYACLSGFLNGTLNVVEDWSENPQNKAEFLHLQAEVEAVFRQLSPSPGSKH
ncbi:MAG: fatty acyl-AMP ligase [Cyanophyceae cyanobacterium]